LRWWVLALIGIVAVGAAGVILLTGGSSGSKNSGEGGTRLPNPSDLPPQTVAIVSHVPSGLGTISRADLDQAIAQGAASAGLGFPPERGTPKYDKAAETALATLLETIWIQGEAAKRGLAATSSEIAMERAKIERENFKGEAQYRKFLAESHYTKSDVRERVRVQLLSSKIQKELEGEAEPPNSKQAQEQVLSDFAREFSSLWRSRTVCLPTYAIEKCSNGPVLAQSSHSGSGETATGGGKSSNSAACSEEAGTPTGDKSYPCPDLGETLPEGSTATVKTNFGTFTIDLATEEAPLTTTSFAYLVKKGFYDGLIFHRIVPGFVIQGGDPLGNGSGGPGYSVIEKPREDLAYTRGVVAMAKTADEAAGTSGSQFFVVTSSDGGLPPEYALLGRVGRGYGTVARIGKLGTPSEKPKERVVIEEVTIGKG
jgi:cyclophilin family peptidyl-prolyl cis-trans isomerase